MRKHLQCLKHFCWCIFHTKKKMIFFSSRLGLFFCCSWNSDGSNKRYNNNNWQQKASIVEKLCAIYLILFLLGWWAATWFAPSQQRHLCTLCKVNVKMLLSGVYIWNDNDKIWQNTCTQRLQLRGYFFFVCGHFTIYCYPLDGELFIGTCTWLLKCVYDSETIHQNIVHRSKKNSHFMITMTKIIGCKWQPHATR